MTGLLANLKTSEEERAAHDTHRPGVVATVLAIFGLYIYLFTDIALYWHLITPEALARTLHLYLAHTFGGDGNVDSYLNIDRGPIYSSDDERLILFSILIAAFLSAYYLPIRFKPIALVIWSALALGVLYGLVACAVLLAAHTLVYMTLHRPKNEAFALLPGAILWVALGAGSHWQPGPTMMWAMMPVLSFVLYRGVMLPLLANLVWAPRVQTLVVQSAIVTVAIGTLYNGVIADESWKFPLGLLLFFFQWERLFMYHIDFKDGKVPDDVTWGRYLAVFFSPGAIPNWIDRVCIGQGYAYLNNQFLCRDKNEIVKGGIKLLLLALMYLVLGEWFRHALVEGFEALGVSVHNGSTQGLIDDYMRGETISPLSIWLTTLLNLAKWFVFFAAVGHFKVGLWRICGYDVAPSFDKPWLATNLVSFWGRFTYHYREFLVRAFYYPVFFKYFRKHRKTRIVVATMASAGLGNLVWGHVVEITYYRGMEWEAIRYVLGHWPYYFLLGLGISLTELYLLKFKRRRKPWSRDVWLVTDVLAAYATVQFFALIHIFNRVAGGSTLWDQTQLFLLAFGIRF
ncbi:MAG: hypothetical protein COX57_06450 [Alphaproteobacteria bacterium CG_4_10_14_0_2_um_filter_63_37]|nr:MAG: hypothetical protein AUJ55_08885 [Proteobacteria bacterium CG1_02_64_396]PJA24829.1 MAG: hypothetical protein COX57_06450 [Alphaproteobacteria bacterium CG_4_10_14_0_2_um_filter_63_37]